MSRCRKLTPEEQAEWALIGQIKDPNLMRIAKSSFIKQVMAKKEGDFSREEVVEQPIAQMGEPVMDTISSINEEPTVSFKPDPLISEQLKEVIQASKEFFQKVPDLVYYTDGIPNLMPLEKEIAMRNNMKSFIPEPIRKRLYSSDTVLKGLAEQAKSILESLHTLEDKQDINESDNVKKAREQAWKGLAKQSGIAKSVLLTQHWDDLLPDEQRALAVSIIPEGSLKYQASWWGKDARFVFAEWQKLTGLPFQIIYERTRSAHGHVVRIQDKYLNKIIKNPLFKNIIHDEVAQERVAMEINSRDPNSGIESPENLTDAEKVMADEIEAIYRMWQPVVRYLRFTESYDKIMEHNRSNPKSPENVLKGIQELIPDAPLENLKIAKELFESASEDALWKFMNEQTWGTINTGYDPRTISQPNLSFKRESLRAVLGKGRLIGREEDTAPLGQEKGFLRRFDTYNRSMATRWYLRKEIDSFNTLMVQTWNKWDNPDQIQLHLKGYLRELQGFPQEGSLFDAVIRRLQKWAYATVFAHPYLGIRNVVQPIWSYPDKDYLVRGLWDYKKLPASLRNKASIRFATVVDQSGRVMRDFLFRNEASYDVGKLPGWLEKALTPLKPTGKILDTLSEWSARIPTMPFTDKVSRSWVYKASMTKAWKAAEQYNKDNNLETWLKTSGIGYLTTEQQSYITELMVMPKTDTYSFGIHGLLNLTGQEAATIKIAEEMVNTTLYMYDRSASARIHYGAHGRSFASLLTFPRSTVLNYSTQLSKLGDANTTIEEKAVATKNIVLLIVFGELLSSILMTVSGKKKKDYGLLNTVLWQFGGLSMSIVQEVVTVFVDVGIAAFGDADVKKQSLSKLPNEITRLGDTLVGFYKIVWDELEVATDEKSGLDTRYLREVRAIFDKSYTPEQQDKAQRTLIEKFQKALTGAEQTDSTKLESALINIKTEEDKLGEIQANGSYYTIQDYSSRVATYTKDIPESLITSDWGFSELALFAYDSRKAWEEYDKLPTDPPYIRTNWRLTHVEEEAAMLFWGKVSKSVFTVGSKDGKEVVSLITSWADYYDINPTMHPKWSGW